MEQVSPVSVSSPVLAVEACSLWERPCLSLFKHAGLEDNWKKSRKVGDVKKTIDKRIGKRAFCIRGAISAANFIEIPDSLSKEPEARAPIGATGSYVYIQYRSVPNMVVMFHLDLATADGQPLRLSCSSLYSTFKFVGQALRIPVRISPDGRWTVFAIDIPTLLAMHAKEPNRNAPEFKFLKGVKLCSNMIVRGVYTSHSIFNPKTLPADMALPLVGKQPWHDTYEWVWCPQAPCSSEATSPVSIDLGFGASPTADEGSPASSASHNSVPEPASTQIRPERPPVHARTNRSFQLNRIIGNSSAMSGSLAWGKDCASLVFPCERAVVAMELNGAEDSPPNAQHFIMGRHTACVNVVSVSNDKTLLVSAQGGREARLCLWDLPKRKWLCDLHGHVSHVTSSCFSADDLYLCTVGRDAQHRCQIIVWDVVALRSGRGVGMGPGTVATNLAIVARQISDFHLNRIKFNPADSTRLLSCGRENIRFWRVSRRHLPGCPAESSVNEYARGLEFTDLEFEASMKKPMMASSSAVQIVFVASSAGTLLQVNYNNRQVLGLLRLHESAITCVNATEGYVVTGAADGLLRLWPLDFSDYLMQAQHDSAVASVAVSDDDLRLAVSTGSGTLGILDVESHAYSTCVRSHKTGVVSTAEASHCDQFATAGKDGTIRIWELESGRQRYEFTATADAPTALDYHPQEQIIACGFESGAVRILSVTDTSTMHEYQQHKEPVHQVLYAPTGKYLYSSAASGSVCVYDVSSAYQPMHFVTADGLLGVKHALRLCASPDGRFVVATSIDGPSDGVVLDGRTLSLALRLDTSNEGGSSRPGHVKNCSVSMDSESVILLTTSRGATYSLKGAIVDEAGMGASSNSTGLMPPATAVGRTLLRNKALPIEAKTNIKVSAMHLGGGADDVIPFLLVSGALTGGSTEGASDDVLYLRSLAHTMQVEIINNAPREISALRVASDGTRIVAIDNSGFLFIWKWDAMAARSQAEESRAEASFDIGADAVGFERSEAEATSAVEAAEPIGDEEATPNGELPGTSASSAAVAPDGAQAIKLFSRSSPGARKDEPMEGAALWRIVGYSSAAHSNLLWDPKTGIVVYSMGCNLVVNDVRDVAQSFPGGHGSCISVLAQSPDGSLVVSGSGPVTGEASDVNASVRVWKRNDGNELVPSFSVHQHDDSGVQSICVLADGFFVSLSCYDEQLEGSMMILWDAAGRMHASVHVPDVVFEVTAMPPHRLRRPAGSNGLRVVTCGVEGVFVWTIQQRKFKSSRLDLATAPSVACITSVLFMEDIWGLGPSLVLGSIDGWVSFWSQSSKSIVGSWHVKDADREQREDVEITSLSNSGSRVFVGGADGLVTVWDLQASRTVVPARPALFLKAPIIAMQWADDGMNGLVGTAEGVLWLLQLDDVVAPEDSVLCVASSPVSSPVALQFVLGSRLFLSAGGEDGALRLTDAELNRQVENIQVKDDSECVAMSCTEPFEDSLGNKHLWCAAAYSDGTLRIFDIFRVALVAKFIPQVGEILEVNFMGRSHLCCCGASGRISITGLFMESDAKVRLTEPTVQVCAGSIRSFHALPSDPKIAAATSVTEDRSWVSIWCLQMNGRLDEMCHIPLLEEPIGACISPWDSNVVICLSRHGPGKTKFEAINLNTFENKASVLLNARVECIATQCDVKQPRVALGLASGSILLVDEAGSITSRCSGHSGPIAALAIAENRLVSSSVAGEVMVFMVD